nr:MAG TPA: hypothetical protein [Caudoviricetes sp.]
MMKRIKSTNQILGCYSTGQAKGIVNTSQT